MDAVREKARFVCGYLGCDAHPFNPMLNALPRQLHVQRSSVGGALIGLGWVLSAWLGNTPGMLILTYGCVVGVGGPVVPGVSPTGIAQARGVLHRSGRTPRGVTS